MPPSYPRVPSKVPSVQRLTVTAWISRAAWADPEAASREKARLLAHAVHAPELYDWLDAQIAAAKPQKLDANLVARKLTKKKGRT